MGKIKISILILLVIFIIGAVSGSRVVATNYEINTGMDDEIRIVQISDYHSSKSTKDSQKIIDRTEQANPDLIILSGDILESEDMTSTVEFVKSLTEIGQVIYSRGNHDNQYETYEKFTRYINNLGVIVLDNANYEYGDYNSIGFEDIDDAYLGYNQDFQDSYCLKVKQSAQEFRDVNKYNILIGHRPNFLECYSEIGADLVFSGHAHGGQWQIPFTDIGLIAPDDGLLTNNVHGLKEYGKTKQIISAGTSNPYRPIIPRLFNPKEVVIVDLVK